MRTLIYFWCLVTVITAEVTAPYSILSPLTPLSFASEGLAHDELLSAIGTPNDNVTKSVYSSLINDLKSAKSVEVKVINKIYIQEGAELNDDFAALSKDLFNIETEYIDFSKNEEATQQINAWVENNTDHRVKDLIRSYMLSSKTASVLLNTFYFKGNWKNKFENIGLRDFQFRENMIQKTTVMHSLNTYAYGENHELDAKIIEIPFEGDEASFLIVLPNTLEGINELKGKLKIPENQVKAYSNLYKTEVDLYVPILRHWRHINPMYQLEDVMGLKEIFNGSAQISHLLKGVDNLFVKDATQVGWAESDEEGVIMAQSKVYRTNWKPYEIPTRSGPVVRFAINRPFYYLLKYKNIMLASGSLFHS